MPVVFREPFDCLPLPRRPVSFGEHVLMFRPRDSYDQRLLDVSLRVSPEPRNHSLDA